MDTIKAMELTFIKVIVSIISSAILIFGGIWGYFSKKFKDIHERIDHINQEEINKIREKMETEYVSKAELESTLNYMKEKIDANEQEIEKRFNNLDKKIDENYNRIYENIEIKLNERFNHIDQKIDEKFNNQVPYRLNFIDQKIDNYFDQLDKKYEKYFDRTFEKIDSIERNKKDKNEQ